MTAAPRSGDVPDGSKTRIDVWLTDPTKWATNAPDIGLSAAEEFNRAHPDYHVEIKRHDFRLMPAEVAAAVERGAPPDLVEYHDAVTRVALDTLGAGGSPLFTPIGRAIAGRSEILGEPVMLDDLMPTVRDYFSYRDEPMSMPRTASTMVLFANMDLLAKAGVTKTPRTWREVTAACRAVADTTGGAVHGIAWPNFYWPFLQAVAQQGGLIADHQNGRSGRAEKVNLASAEMMAYVGWWRRLYQDGHYLYTGKPGDFPGCFTAFENQEVAIVLSSSVDAWHMLQRGERKGFAVEVGPLPYNDEVEVAGSILGGMSVWLTAGLSPAKQDGALAFLQYLNSPRNAAAWALHHYRIPITRAAAEILDREGLYQRNPNLRVAGDQLEAADRSAAALGPLLGGHAEITNELTAAMHDVLTGGAEPGARFREAERRAQRILDDYNAYCDGPPRRTPDLLAVSI